MTLLSVCHLTTSFKTRQGPLCAVCDLSFDLNRGEMLAIVGESASGKSVTALSIAGLLTHNDQAMITGEIFFDGINLRLLSEKALCQLRGKKISMIFQEPMSALNPVQRVGEQIAEAYALHHRGERKMAREKSIEMLGRVGIDRPSQRYFSYPHELSGGQRQRVMIAMALICSPELLIADEPTTALDVTVQAQILELIDQLRAEYGMAIILIIHDLGVAWGRADTIAVMYAGKIVEMAPRDDFFSHPRHPYSVGLIQSIPPLLKQQGDLKSISGHVPDLLHMPVGCPYQERCEHVQQKCRQQMPLLEASLKQSHRVRCFYPY